MKLMLVDAKPITPAVRLMKFEAASGEVLPAYTPGAHLEFDLGGQGTRAYSLIDWPEVSDQYVIAVQREDDGAGGSLAMHDLKPGCVLDAEPPKNDFELADGAAPVLLLAGGIGITPLISMASTLQLKSRSFSLHYTARNRQRMAFGYEVQQAFGTQTHLHFDDEAPLDLSALMRAQAPQTQIYLCGPRGMIDAARAAALANGFSDEVLHIELFTTAAPQTNDTAFEVEIKDTGQVIQVGADQTIIAALEDAGVDVMYDCQRGDCGICQCDVISGVPDHRDVVLSQAERDAGNVMQICVSRAKSDRLVLDL